MTEDSDSMNLDADIQDFLSDHAGAGLEDVTDRDIGEGILGIDIRAQLIAIRSVLARNRQVEQKAAAEIDKLAAEMKKGRADSWIEDQWVDSLYSYTFLDAAHSMAAVGLIAPLFESLFDQAFRSLKRELPKLCSLESNHKRWQLKDPWDYRIVWVGGRGHKLGIAKGIPQLAESIGLRKHLPSELERTLTILFEYRNKMLHHGFEWPDTDREKFAHRIDSNGWTDCFRQATSGGKPRIFYMSRDFIDHCLDTVDEIIDGIGRRLECVDDIDESVDL